MDTIKCEVCGIVFPNRAFKVTNSQNITFENFTTNCPNGHTTKAIADGTYDFDEDGFARKLRQIPKKDLEKIKFATIDIHRRGGTKEDFREAVAEIIPAYSTFFDSFLATLKDKHFQFWMKWLLGLITVIMGGEAVRDINVNVSVNNVVNNHAPDSNKTSFSDEYKTQLRRKNLENIKLKADTAARNKNFKK